MSDVETRLTRVEVLLDAHVKSSEARSNRVEKKVDSIGSKIDRLVGVVETCNPGCSPIKTTPDPKVDPKDDDGPSITLTPANVAGAGIRFAKWATGILAAFGLAGGALHECAPTSSTFVAVRAPEAPVVEVAPPAPVVEVAPVP